MFVFKSWYLFPLFFLSLIHKRVCIKVPSLSLFKKSLRIADFFFLLAHIFAVLALLRPQRVEKQISEVSGIDIVIGIDVSESMLMDDIYPSRIEEAKKVVKDFLAKRNNDRVGIVIFGEEAFPKVPLTLDYDLLKEKVSEIEIGKIPGKGTAIGKGLAVALALLKKSKAKSKIVILVTDGSDTSRSNLPLQSAALAKQMDIKIYPIGIGESVLDIFNVSMLDERLLREIAKISKGQYFKSNSKFSLSKIFEEIEKLEKSELPNSSFERIELFIYFLVVSLLFLLIALFFSEVLWTQI